MSNKIHSQALHISYTSYGDKEDTGRLQVTQNLSQDGVLKVLVCVIKEHRNQLSFTSQEG